MRCGANCFLVEIEVKGVKQLQPVIARTPVEARKAIRIEFGEDAQIFAVIKEKKK